MERIIWSTVKGTAAEGNTYDTGFLFYAGLLMIVTSRGNLKCIEFNCCLAVPGNLEPDRVAHEVLISVSAEARRLRGQAGRETSE